MSINKKIKNATQNTYDNIQFKSRLETIIYKTLKENGINSLICYNYKIDKYYMISSSKFKIGIDNLIKRIYNSISNFIIPLFKIFIS